MNDSGEFVNKYAVSATFQEKTVVWQFKVELSNGERITLNVLDGAEIPVLLEIARSDRSLYFDPKTRTLSTGWNDPGG